SPAIQPAPCIRRCGGWSTAYVHSEWEPERTAAGDGRPVRRYYEVTAAGARALDGAIEQVRAIGGLRRLAPKGAR
ncbi:MAG TPA: hypothetical protein VKH42_00435, partial [Vicinamibacterales bacterium]|nr:hypothetical protein [Vicinamibacterales bacterium]